MRGPARARYGGAPFRACRTIAALLLAAAVTACVGVDMVRLTSRTFPPKPSPAELTVLDREPLCPHIRLAELTVVDDSPAGFEAMQNKILEKAAALGADAVVFARPETPIHHQITYEPFYSPWGYSAYAYPGWGYGGWGYGSYGYGYGGTAIPYDYQVRSLRGLAVRYKEGPREAC